MYNELTRRELAQEAWRIKRQDLSDAVFWMATYRRYLNNNVDLGIAVRGNYEYLIELNCRIWCRLIREIVEIEEQILNQ